MAMKSLASQISKRAWVLTLSLINGRPIILVVGALINVGAEDEVAKKEGEFWGRGIQNVGGLATCIYPFFWCLGPPPPSLYLYEPLLLAFSQHHHHYLFLLLLSLSR